MRILRSLCMAAVFLLYASPALAAVSTFDFVVPKRGTLTPSAGCVPPYTGSDCQFEISSAKVTLQLDSALPATVTVTRKATSGTDSNRTVTTNAMALDSATPDCFAPSGACIQLFPLEPGATAQDSVEVIKPLQFGADPNSAAMDKLVLRFYFASNYNDATSPCPTASPMPGNETWTVSVAGANRIQGVAVQSLDTHVTGSCPNIQSRAIPENEGPVITVTSPAPTFTSGRIGLDAMMVLDRSGSMSGTDGGAQTRLASLKNATNRFLAMWNTLRQTEFSSGLVALPPDKVGVVFFDNATQWITGTPTQRLVSFPAIPEDLSAATPGPLRTIMNNIGAVSVAGSTSIGNGLIAATQGGGVLPLPGDNRRVVLLMTDGQQNTAKFAFASGTQIMTSDDPGGAVAPVALEKQPFQLYSVTLGNAFGADAPINQALANATGGYSLHAFNQSDDVLDVYFLQLLQNFHKFSTVEAMRIVQDQTRSSAPFEMDLPVTSTTTRLAFSLGWLSPNAGLRLVLVPPGGAAAIPFAAAAPGERSIARGLRLPLAGTASALGNWKIRVIPDTTRNNPERFSLVILGDDATINTSLAAVSAEPIVGGKIRLTAQVNDFGAALRGLGSQPGAVVKAYVVAPGANVGDVLSDSNVAPATTTGDLATPAQNKMAALMAANPAAFARNSSEIILRDDRTNGDAVANDGVYTAEVPANFEGHYNFVFHVEGTSQSGGRFVRQQIRTVHIRSMPVPGTTTVTSSSAVLSEGSVLAIHVTPRNVNGGKLGPGWRNYLWLKAAGRAPVKPVDNLNGSYTATIPFSGATPPAVSVTFLPEAVPRADTFVPTDATLAGGIALVEEGTAPLRRAMWLAFGSTFPSGSFSNGYKRDLAVNGGIEFPMAPNTALEATLGSHQFKGRNGAPDIDVTQFAVNGKWYFPQPGFAPFVTLGAGAYAFDPGSTRFGVNAGAGIQVKLAPPWSLEGRYTFHGVSGNSPNSRYSTLAVGLRLEF